MFRLKTNCMIVNTWLCDCFDMQIHRGWGIRIPATHPLWRHPGNTVRPGKPKFSLSSSFWIFLLKYFILKRFVQLCQMAESDFSPRTFCLVNKYKSLQKKWKNCNFKWNIQIFFFFSSILKNNYHFCNKISNKSN